MRRWLAPTLVALSLSPLASAPLAADTIVYGANRDRQIYTVNLTQGLVTQVGTLLVGTQAIEQDPETGYVYYFERDTTGDEFLYWDPATGANVRVRRYTPAPGFFAKRLAFHPDGTLYLMDQVEVLWIIDKTTGDLTRLGTVSGLVTGSRGGTGDIAFGPDGTLYLNTYRNVYTVNLATLAATPLHVNILGNGQIGMGLAYCNDALYAALADEVARVIRIVRIETAVPVMSTIYEGLTILNDLSSCPAGEPPAPPSAPSGLTAQALLDGRVQLQWQDTSLDEQGFRIERHAGGAFQQIATVGPDVTSYVDAGVVPFTTYTYRVRAFNAGGTSAYTDEASATTVGNSAPTPQILQPANGTVFPLGATIHFSGDATDAQDASLPDSAFVWTAARVGGSFRPFASGVRTTTGSATSPGQFIVRLTVTDSGGLASSVEVRFTVQ